MSIYVYVSHTVKLYLTFFYICILKLSHGETVLSSTFPGQGDQAVELKLGKAGEAMMTGLAIGLHGYVRMYLRSMFGIYGQVRPLA